VAKRHDHTSFYLACGATDAPLIIFVHGWPELSISWRHQLPVFAALGFRAIAPDMRLYGRSTVYTQHEDYAVQHAVSDMLALLQSLGRDKALWVDHDWGSPVVWSLASHHPERCVGIANLCVPYLPEGFAREYLLHGTYDLICETTANSRFADPMRKACSNLTEGYIKSGHYMAQEQPVAVNRALARFIAEKLPELLS